MSDQSGFGNYKRGSHEEVTAKATALSSTSVLSERLHRFVADDVHCRVLVEE